MRAGRLLYLLAILLLLLGLGTAGRAWADSAPAPDAQTGFVTPTPGPDGRVVYVVKEGDDLWTIAALSGKTLEELMALNGIQPGDYIIPGMQLVLGFGGPVEATAGPGAQPSPTSIPATPTPAMNVPIRLNPGDVQYVEFGAQPSAALGGDGGPGGQRSPLLGVVGLALLLAAGGLGYLASRYGRE